MERMNYRGRLKMLVLYRLLFISGDLSIHWLHSIE